MNLYHQRPTALSCFAIVAHDCDSPVWLSKSQNSNLNHMNHSRFKCAKDNLRYQNEWQKSECLFAIRVMGRIKHEVYPDWVR